MRLVVYDMLVNVNGISYVHVCEQARWARSAGNSAIDNLYTIQSADEALVANKAIDPDRADLDRVSPMNPLESFQEFSIETFETAVSGK